MLQELNIEGHPCIGNFCTFALKFGHTQDIHPAAPENQEFVS